MKHWQTIPGVARLQKHANNSPQILKALQGLLASVNVSVSDNNKKTEKKCIHERVTSSKPWLNKKYRGPAYISQISSQSSS